MFALVVAEDKEAFIKSSHLTWNQDIKIQTLQSHQRAAPDVP